MMSGRVWMFALIYFGLIYGLYALAFFLPTIIGGFEAQFGTHFNVFQKGMITAIPYLPAAVALFLWSRSATKRGVRAWHIGIPALIGAAEHSGCALHDARRRPASPSSRSPPARSSPRCRTSGRCLRAFLSGAAAAAGIALINTVGNLAGFVAPYITGVDEGRDRFLSGADVHRRRFHADVGRARVRDRSRCAAGQAMTPCPPAFSRIHRPSSRSCCPRYTT